MPPFPPGNSHSNDQPAADHAEAAAPPHADEASETPTLPPRSAPSEQLRESKTMPPRQAAGDGAEGAVPPRLSLPGYEILGELGRGGMGVVYQARQEKLNRLVALKMILAAGHAGAADLARFVTEAEAIARLQHPNIVQIHEVGEHGGLPYFSLEFCPGGSLDKKLAGTPLPPGEAAALVETLARAMQAAHEKGVIHRDLKPANVLLAEDGTPKITDFGLAKKLDDAAGQTASGVIMGTPSYMAPEQAGGKGKDIGPHTDVYALGAILYECLTGRPPFRAATSLDTILQVLSDEPVPPWQLQPKTPPDLETVCLKCLQKEPRRRYASAADLAEDLRRYQAGEPIQARPVGRVERAAKWVRRNPVLAGMAAAVALALLGGAAVSTGFGIDARWQAERAKANEADALAKGEKLAAANESLTRTANELERKRGELRREADDLQTTLARSLIRPLRMREGGGEVSVTEPEWEAFWELAVSRGGNLGYRFIEEASGTPVTSRQLRDRASVALPAAVGLDPERRDQVEKLLMGRLDDPAIGEDQKKDLALAAAAWEGLSSPAACRTARQLAQALRDSKDWNVRYALAPGLRAAADHMQARDAARAADAIVQAMKDAKDPGALPSLAEGLSAVAARMEARDAVATATRAAPVLVRAIADAKEPSAPLAESLSSLAKHMEVRDAVAAATRAAPALVRAIKAAHEPNALARLAEGLSAVTAHMEARDAAAAAAEAAPFLVRAMRQTTKDPNSLGQLAWGLSVVADRMNAKDAAVITAQAAPILIQAMKDANGPNAWYELNSLARDLAAVTARMDARDAGTTLVQAMKDANNAYALYHLARCLAAAAARMEAKDAATATTQASLLLVQAMDEARDPNHLTVLAQGLWAVAAYMDTRGAAQAAAILLRATEDTKEPKAPSALSSLARAFPTVAARMDARDAAPTLAQAAARLVRAIKVTAEPNALSGLARSLSAVADRMEPRDAAAATAQAAPVLVQAMKDARTPFAAQYLPTLAQGLAAVAARMDARDAATATAQAASVLVRAMKEARGPSAAASLSRLALGLSAVAARMDAHEAATAAGQAASILLQALRDAVAPSVMRPGHGDLDPLTQGLGAVAACMDARDRADVLARAAGMLIQAMKDARSPNDVSQLAQALSAHLVALAPAEILPRCATTSAAVSYPAGTTPLTALTLLIPAAEPPPCRLSTQQLVELLKMPTCIGAARRVVLDQLGNRYRRPFADVWQFVHFAQEQHLDLDFTTPPQRPEPAGPVAVKP